MALQTIQSGLSIPAYMRAVSFAGLIGKQINASGEKFAAIIKVPKTGTISKVGFRTGGVTTAETLKVGLETVSGGDPTGTAYGGMVAGTQASPVADTWYTVALGTDATATVNDTIAVVIEFDSTVGDLQIDSVGVSLTGFPYIDHFTASWLKDDMLPAISLEYSDGTYENMGALPVDNLPGATFNSGSTPDERALRFSLPFPCSVSGFWGCADTNRNAFDIVLYEGTTAKGTVSFGTSEYSSTSTEIFMGRFDSRISITKNTEYFLALKPGASSVTLRELTIDAAVIMDSLDGGQNIHLGTRTDAGVWTTDTTRRPFMGIIIDQFDDGVGGGVSPIDIHNTQVVAPFKVVSYR